MALQPFQSWQSHSNNILCVLEADGMPRQMFHCSQLPLVSESLTSWCQVAIKLPTTPQEIKQKSIENTMEVSVDTILEAGGRVNEWNSEQELKSCT